MKNTSDTRVHAFGDDAIGDLDAVGVADAIASGTITAVEATEAAIARAESVEPHLSGIVHRAFDAALAEAAAPAPGVFSGVPTFIKDNTAVAGMPTNHGTRAFVARPAPADEPFTRQYRSTGAVVLGKTTLPEFGFNASTEFEDGRPTRNPWHTDYSCGASSGGSAAMVASGVVPFAHANDGGGSIRIPAAACGLVGLKMTRGREEIGADAKGMPVNIVSNGIVSRSVRDSAAFAAAIEQYRPVARLPRIGHVTGPSTRRLRIGLILDSLTPEPTDDETRAAVLDVAELARGLGHRVVERPLPVGPEFVKHFSNYWALLGFSLHRFGPRLMDPSYDRSRNDALTKGLAREFSRRPWTLPGTIAGLRRSTQIYREAFRDVDVIMSPVLAHTTPLLGHLSPANGFDVLFPRLLQYVGFTPANNASGGPAISLPLAQTSTGLPLGIHVSADLGDERTLLELAFELEEARPFARIHP
ncbi:Amidase [Aeromicrobium marinum DSM 15272]|uniref:Amidase n=1 Tax=Aeromicrobium marinum DSM 15272 TaxID=585531 RepID=E2SAZ6_9ACTN|nr:amidase [Aeromicrobium marinum]EFQ83542.1 Amidase [Aeromicrobium marinum DSM 15272]